MGNLGNILLVPGVDIPTVRGTEPFVAANGTLITALSPPWTKQGAATNTVAPTIDNNLLHGENAATGSYYYRSDFVPAGPDYDVTAQVVLKTDNDASQAGPAGRMDPTANTMYYAHYPTLNDGWELAKRVTGTFTRLGSLSLATLTVDQRYTVTLRMRGSLIQMLVDGAVLVSVTDTAIPGPGLAGIRIAGAATSTVGLQIGSWEVRQ